MILDEAYDRREASALDWAEQGEPMPWDDEYWDRKEIAA